MLAGEAAGLLDMELLLPDMAGLPMVIEGCYIGDLLSNVMAAAAAGQLWFTVITNINIVAVAQLLGLSGIVLLEGRRPAPEVLDRARTEGIPLFSDSAAAYEAALKFHQALGRA
jgi:hypothetical protein